MHFAWGWESVLLEDAMVVVNQDGEIVLLNVQAEKQFGYKDTESLSFSSVFHLQMRAWSCKTVCTRDNSGKQS
jgi:PAS domain-containing protein